MSVKKRLQIIILSTAMSFLIIPADISARELKDTEDLQTEELDEFMEDAMHEIDFYSLEELLDVEVEVASLFAEDELVVGSMVSSITSEQWKRLGARRTSDALANELSVLTVPHILGSNLAIIRGYATDSSNKGVAYLVDGVPLNTFIACDISQTANFDLGVLDRIELIKGPGSAIYGSDAFHGVVSMKTFESEKDHYSVNAAGAYPLYGDANVKISQGFDGNLFRLNFSAATSGQAPLEQDYEYDYPGSSFPPTNPAEGEGTRETSYNSHTGVLKLDINPSRQLKIRLGSYINAGDFNDYPGLSTFPVSGSLEKYDTTHQETFSYFENVSATYTLANDISIEGKGYHYYYDQKAVIQIDMYGSTNHNDYEGSRIGADLIIKQPDNSLNLQWLIAYSYSYLQAIDGKTYNTVKPPSTIPVSSETENFADRSRTIHSAYTQTKWGMLKDTLYLLLGCRLDNYSDYGNQVTPRGGVILLPTEKTSVKALYGRAFRAGAATEVYGIYGYINENKDIKPETIDIYELIMMYKEKKYKVTLNGYYSRWENGIITELDLAAYTRTGAPLTPVNKGINESYGGECSIFYSIDPVAFDLGLSYVRSRAVETLRPDIGSMGNEIIEKEDYVAFPEYIANLGFYYTLTSIDINFYLKNRFYYGMKETHYNYKSEPGDLPLYWRADLNISKIIDRRAELFLDIHNLFNRKNYLPSLYGAHGGYEEPGISVLLRAGYKL